MIWPPGHVETVAAEKDDSQAQGGPAKGPCLHLLNGAEESHECDAKVDKFEEYV